MTETWSVTEYHAYLRGCFPGIALPVSLETPQGRTGLSEKAFMAAVVKLATEHGWKVFHPFDSRKSIAGYPDLTMVKPQERVIWAELKIEGEQPTIEQCAWLEMLREAVNTEAYLWYPKDFPQIEARLTRRQESSHAM